MKSAVDNNPAAHVLPNAGSKESKKEQVANMFNDIAPKYDFLNHLLSLGIDKIWRKKAIKFIAGNKPNKILDVATGTGDLALKAASTIPNSKITGVDIAVKMLDEGRKKISIQGYEGRIEMMTGDSEDLPFETNSYDAVMCAYGIRNFANLENGLKDMCRVMKTGGRLAILEFSTPKQFPVKQFYQFYFKYILPKIGGAFSNHNTAYSYLPESVNAFPDGERMVEILENCGFKQAKAQPLTFGVTTLYTATK